METERRACLRVAEGEAPPGDDDWMVEGYFWEISWIARSMSSRSLGVAGVVGLLEGVVGAGLSSLGFRFFFLLLDFFEDVGCCRVVELMGMDGGSSVDGAVCSSSSGSSISFNCHQFIL